MRGGCLYGMRCEDIVRVFEFLFSFVAGGCAEDGVVEEVIVNGTGDALSFAGSW